MAGSVLILGFINVLFGEFTPAGGGFGWDGVTYATITRDLGVLINEGHLNKYYAQRLLPSTVVRGILTATNLSFSNINIIKSFQVYNCFLLACGTWVWKRISDNRSLSRSGRWIGFGGIFVNFLISKATFYAAVGTDATALLIALVLLLGYLERRPFLIFITAIAGCFVWQVDWLYGAALMISLYMTVPQRDIEPGNSPSEQTKIDRLIKYGWVTAMFLCVIGYLTTVLTARDIVWGAPQVHALERLLTGLPSMIAVLIALAMMIGSTRLVRSVLSEWKSIRPVLLLLTVAGILIPAAIVRLIANPNLPNPSGLLTVLAWMFFPLNGEGKFLLPFLTITLAWGPTLLLLVLLWKDVCVELRRLGPGVMAVVGVTIPLGLVTEPRFVMGAWPSLVLALVLVLEGKSLTKSFMIAFFALSFFFAQFWLKINLAPWKGGDMDGLLDFPKQLLFLHYGPWMSFPSYLLFVPVVALSGYWLRKTIARPAPSLA